MAEMTDDRCTSSAGAGTASGRARVDDVRRSVREKYAAAASEPSTGPGGTCCSPADEAGLFGSSLYTDSGEAGSQDPAVNGSLGGCGVPTAVADLRRGEIVLDLGSGGEPTS